MTLVEVIIGMAIFSMAILATLGIFAALSRQQNNNAGRRTVQQESRELIESISRDIRGAATVQINSPYEIIVSNDQVTASSIRYTHSQYYGESSGVVYKEICSPSCGGSRGQQVTPEGLVVDELTFEALTQQGQRYYKLKLNATLVSGSEDTDQTNYRVETLVNSRE